MEDFGWRGSDVFVSEDEGGIRQPSYCLIPLYVMDWRGMLLTAIRKTSRAFDLLALLILIEHKHSFRTLAINTFLC